MFTKEDTNKIKGIAVLMLIFHHLYLVDDDISYLAERSFSFSVIDLPITAVCFRICVYIFCFLSAYGTSAGLKDRKCDLKYYDTYEDYIMEIQDINHISADKIYYDRALTIPLYV